jgi:hypothetical protein
MGECKSKVTASRLPYFDGDYWPGAAEDMISQLRQEEDDRKLHKKSKTSGNASKDAMLMEKVSLLSDSAVLGNCNNISLDILSFVFVKT